MPERDSRILADFTPAELAVGQRRPLPGSELVATLLDSRYREGRPRRVAWARVVVAHPDGREETRRWDFGHAEEVFGQRLFLTGSRSRVLLYALPSAAGEEAPGVGEGAAGQDGDGPAGGVDAGRGE